MEFGCERDRSRFTRTEPPIEALVSGTAVWRTSTHKGGAAIQLRTGRGVSG